jgi:hypothetical protein
VYREEAQHNFPMPHRDVLEQFIPYRVPVDKFGDLAAFDGSVLVDRTKGLMSARCAGEGGNFLALNLADEIIQGKMDVATARRTYAEAMKERMEGRTPEIMKRLMFDVTREDTANPDQPIGYGEVNDTGDLKRIFAKIRSDVAIANSQSGLTQLHLRAGHFVMLARSPAWEKHFGSEVNKLRHLAEDEFTKTAHKINDRAKVIGSDSNYEENWGDLNA